MYFTMGFPGGSVVKKKKKKNMSLIPGLRRFPGEENLTTAVLLWGISHGERNLAGYSPEKSQTWLSH